MVTIFNYLDLLTQTTWCDWSNLNGASAPFLRLPNKIKLMKTLVLLSILFLITNMLSAQKVFSVQYASQADVKVFVVEYESQADLKVHKKEYTSQATGNEGNWFFTEYESQADKSVYFVAYASQADITVYFVKYASQAGWRNKSKQHHFY